MTLRVLILAALVALTGCWQDDQPPPRAVTMSEDAVGYYCQMLLLEHTGPKAQIHIAGQQHPLWFSQIRDAIAFMRSPEETAEIRAVFVNDMARAKTWDDPGADNWIAAGDAYFVIDSTTMGGMGAPEAIPFATETAADSYIASHGGKRVRLADIPDDYVLAPVDVSPAPPATGAHEIPGHHTQTHHTQTQDMNANGTQTQ